ncbi:hypothetical protein ABT294_40200 [Nonomuraea sp. NPDC000554]|uniref:hypothetical protein n=1 Tax=Nonomuraea sp. NPDC000554 TaxID=3154259 RepID=UPI00331E7C90
MVLFGGSGSGRHQIIEDASQAHAEGRRVFVARLSASTDKASHGRSLPEIANLVEAIEAHGWRLDQMATSVMLNSFNRYDNITCLFRRTE